ncbi:hypothetical protein [uncultured Cellulomonas sp.]|uniref:hypothetical protein n=1 Tax=uncultured Cellulomonas sp. TaxID=189682 RepID=UPI0028EAA595|nr:hypothetical protein [uncultured Cellulomonas sp.]
MATGPTRGPTTMKGTIMTVLDDITTALKDYPSTYVTIEIIDVNWPGAVISDEDEVEFRFQVTNSGPLEMTDLSFKIEGLHGTLVKGNGAAAQYVASWETNAGWFPDLPAHQPNNPVTWSTLPFMFRPTRPTTTSKELVRVSVAGWQTSWDHPLTNHSEADPDAKGSYSSTVAVQ